MLKKLAIFFKTKILLVLLIGFVIGVAVMISANKVMEETSTNEFCEKCHVHPHSTESWKLSTHYDNPSGVHVNCVDCHLPPKGHGYVIEKAKLGIHDLYGYLFKDTSDFNWEAKSTVDAAQHFVFKSSCINCHANLFPLTLSKEGQDAHLYYSQNENDLHCINCHLHVGHYDPNAKHESNVGFGMGNDQNTVVYTEPAKVEKFENFTETIPNTSVSFKMVAIPGGEFMLGNSENDKFAKSDEVPSKKVKISRFFMAETEVSWNEYLAFYSQTGAEGRSTDTEGARTSQEVDAITGPTPPYGQPDQNWGLGSRPAITMRYHAAETYCKWLSKVTGKKYRLPTEAEWEYACRANTSTPYFFDGDPKKYSGKNFWHKITGTDTTTINTFVIYAENSEGKTQKPDRVKANPLGLKNMLGNVAEFCSDWYAHDAYKNIQDGAVDPKGPATGEEHVIRGGSFKSDPQDVRSASRGYTQSTAWMKTDPQMPKSIWWYSDCNHVGFRVVCEAGETLEN
ncbi:MAG: SUMF1/EgtB/PvdO family nonheme iron enzyme [Prolixibacteraceae bacterium]|jgi:formylglycine-generating enzyme required for sulfatase activity/nitrate/TMAO reductase-like tetraheme cytochrome c subunit|nr:SUMF1/EgtB/PvdO family nonheme iron enzyme [Prolixibacteraceae bacterium]